MANPIVVVNVSLTQPPAPTTLQKTGAIISQGGTILGPQAYTLLTQTSDLTQWLSSPVALSTLAWSNAYGGEVTATASGAHGIAVGETFVTTIAGAVPVGYNGTFFAIATSSTQFIYYLAVNPGSETTPGTYTPRGVAELQAQVNTFFGQGGDQSVFVLECGAGEPAVGIAALTAFIANTTPQKFYAYLVPRYWDATSQFLALIAQFENNNSQTYFLTTTTLQNYGVYTAVMKCVIPMMEAPGYGVWAANTVTAASWTSGLATVTTTTNHGVAPGQYFQIAGVVPAGYNGWYQAQPGTTGSSLVYAVANPGSYVSGGTLVASFYSSQAGGAPNAGIPPTEFSLATYFQEILSATPSSSTPVAPFAFRFLFGVTSFPVQGNAALLTALAAASISYIANANQAGLTQNMLYLGYTKDGKPFNFWYSVDWFAINLVVNLGNEVVNGSNNKPNPLFYNQAGINRLLARAIDTGITGIQAGLALGQAKQTTLDQATFNNNVNEGAYAGNLVCNAVPFPTYTAANPSDYPVGIYRGLSMVMSPLLGFVKIMFNLDATLFVGSNG